MFRNPRKDKMKSEELILLQENVSCSVCGTKGLTLYHGPGQDELCRSCQLKEVSYEQGMGYLSRPSTFHRRWNCDHCGYDPRQDVRLHKPNWSSEKQKALWTSQLIGDHILAKKSGGSNLPENIQTLCWVCNAVKSMEHDDWNSHITLNVP